MGITQVNKFKCIVQDADSNILITEKETIRFELTSLTTIRKDLTLFNKLSSTLGVDLKFVVYHVKSGESKALKRSKLKEKVS